jgi:hypothetical protein
VCSLTDYLRVSEITKDSSIMTAPVKQTSTGLLKLSATFACFLSISVAHGDQTWSGGSNQWDVGYTSDWNGSTWMESYDPATQTVTNAGNTADFTSAGGMVTVDDSQPGGSVAATELYFGNNGGGAYDLTGDTIYTDNSYFGTIIDVEGGSSAVTIDSEVWNAGTPTTGTYSNPSFGSDDQWIVNNSSSDLTLNGAVDYNHQTTLFVSANGSGKIIFNGGILDAQGTGLYLQGGGTVEFGASADMSSLDSGFNGSNLSLIVNAGTALLDADTFLSTSHMTIGGNSGDAQHGILTNAAFVGTQDLTDERATALLGGNAQVISGWSGSIYLDNLPTSLTFSQVAGGRFIFSGSSGVYGNNHTYLVTSGGGTVVLATSSSYTDYSPNGQAADGGNLAADLQAAKTLITNAPNTGSAFGNSAGEVQVEAGKLLGGTGYTTQKVVAMDASSIITAGDPGDSSLGILPSIGTLNLSGGLQSAANGLTLDFKLNGGVGTTNPGTYNDYILVGNLSLTGTVTINLTTLSTVDTDSFYVLMSGGGTWTGSPTFVINTPAGYELDNTYGMSDGTSDGLDLGYSYNTLGDAFTVKLIAAPEPSTYAMMLGALALLGFCVRRRVATIG